MPRDDSAAYSSRCGTFEWCDADYARTYLPRHFCEQLASSIAPTMLGIDAQPGESLLPTDWDELVYRRSDS